MADQPNIPPPPTPENTMAEYLASEACSLAEQFIALSNLSEWARDALRSIVAAAYAEGGAQAYREVQECLRAARG